VSVLLLVPPRKTNLSAEAAQQTDGSGGIRYQKGTATPGAAGLKTVRINWRKRTPSGGNW